MYRVAPRLDLGNDALGPCGHFASLHAKKFEVDQDLSRDLAQGGSTVDSHLTGFSLNWSIGAAKRQFL